MFARILKSKDKTPFGRFMHDFMTSARNKAKFSAPKQLIAVALSIAERSGLHYIPVAQRKEEGFAHVLKDSEASKKAWRVRERANVPGSEPTGIEDIWSDNPGGSWERHEQNRADERMKEGRKVSGSPTAGFTGRLLSLRVASLPGMMDEHLSPDLLTDHKSQDITASIQSDGVQSPVFINVNHRGEAFINEGNHRAKLARLHNQRTVPVTVSYFAGGENAPGPWNLDDMRKRLERT